MISIDFSATFSGKYSRLRSYIEEYNKPFLYTKKTGSTYRSQLKYMLRPEHERCMIEIIKMYGAQLIKRQKLEPITHALNLPALKQTSASAVASATGVSVRTAQRHLQRLQESLAITITRTGIHDSYYSITINPKILALRKNGFPLLTHPHYLPEIKPVNNPSNNPLIRLKKPENNTVLHPITLTGQSTQKQAIKKINSSSCPTNNTCTLNNLLTTADKNVENPKHNPYPSTFLEKLEKNHATARGKEPAIATNHELSGGGPQPVTESARNYVQLLMMFVVSQLYSNYKYLTRWQLDFVETYLYQEFRNSSTTELETYNQLIYRLIKCSRRSRTGGFNPLPSFFFNQNKKGSPGHFSHTETYINELNQRQRSGKLIKYQQHFQDFMRRWKAFVYATNYIGCNGMDWDNYHKGYKYLKNKYPELCDAYQEIILDNFKQVS